MARLAFVHPNRKRLLAWLEQSDVLSADDQEMPNAVTTHVEQCERCADRLEELATLRAHELEFDPEIGAALREVYEPPAGINDRVMMKIDARERADREMNLFLGLFGIATDAADLMMPDDPSGDDHAQRGGLED